LPPEKQSEQRDVRITANLVTVTHKRPHAPKRVRRSRRLRVREFIKKIHKAGASARAREVTTERKSIPLGSTIREERRGGSSSVKGHASETTWRTHRDGEKGDG
jgi:hypothetical protein